MSISGGEDHIYLRKDIPNAKKIRSKLGDFQRNGRLYYLLDTTRKDEAGVDTKPHIETITMASNTDDMTKILQNLEAQVETTAEDGYTSLLTLDRTTIKWRQTDRCNPFYSIHTVTLSL